MFFQSVAIKITVCPRLPRLGYQKFELYDNLKKNKIKDNPDKFILLRLFKSFRSSSCFLNFLAKRSASVALLYKPMSSFRRLFQKFEPYDNLKKYKIKDNPNKFILLRLFKNFRSSSCFLKR